MITLVVLGAALLVTAVLVGLDRLIGRPPNPLDTEQQERWLVHHAPGRLQPALRYVDRRVAGGVMTAVAFAVLFTGALVVGYLLDSIDGNRGFARWDKGAAQWGADHASATSTTVLDQITRLGSTMTLVVVMAVVGLVMTRSRGWGALGYLALVGIGSSALNNGLKLLVHRERPDIDRLATAAGWSFPSGHSAAAAACWAAMALVVFSRSRRAVRAWAAVAAVFIALAVATSRVLLGVHWLTDVLAGLGVGWSWFFLCTVLFGGRLLRFGEPAVRVARGTDAPVPADRVALATTASPLEPTAGTTDD